LLENMVLAPYTTLRIGGRARYFTEVANEEELRESLNFAKGNNLPVFILGGGSNVLFADVGFNGLVVRPLFKGLETSEVGPHYVQVRVGAGEVLDEVIAWTVENGWWGMENLSFIPGLSGALAIQNVGAYGQEASEVIESVEVFDMVNGKSQMLNRDECGFTYRHSRFNTYDKGRFVILSVTLKLKKDGKPNLTYKDLQEYFNSPVPLKAGSPSLMHKRGRGELLQMRQAVIKIRKDKGQDPDKVWTAGSFFSNFRLTQKEFASLLERIKKDFGEEKSVELQTLVNKVKAPSDEGRIKVPAAWILDQLLNLKGMQVGGARLSERQVLNVINVGSATAKDCIELFEKVRSLVYQKTGLTLVSEPEFVGPDSDSVGIEDPRFDKSNREF